MKSFLMTMIVVLGTSVAFAADPAIGPGKHIKVDYTLTVDNEEIETSVGKEPLEFDIGSNTIIPGLESQVMGMRQGEEKIVTVEPKDGYGDVDPKAIKEFPKSTMPKEAEPKVGMVLQAKAPDGEEFPAVIKELKGDQVVLDFNHPLAGKILKFKVKVLAITDSIQPKVETKPIADLTPVVPVSK